MRSRSYYFLILAIALLVLGGCEKKESQQFRIGTNVWPGYEGLYLAEHKGFFEGANIRLVPYPSASTASQDFRSGLLEAIALTMDEALFLASEKVDFKIIMIFDISHGGDMLIAAKGIKSMAQLKGRRVALESSALGAYMLSRALDHTGLKLEDIVPLNMQLNQHEKVMMDGEADAVVTFDPVSTRLLSAGYNKLFDSSQIPGEIVDVLLVRTEFLENNPGAVEKLLSGYFRAMQYQKENFDESIQFMATREAVSPEQFKDSLKGLIIPDLAENKRMLGAGQAQLVKTFYKLMQVMQGHKLLFSPVEPEKLIDAGPIQKLSQ